MDDTDPWDLDRPDRLLRWLEQEVVFDEPAAYLVRVDVVDGEQRAVGWTRLWDEPPAVEHPDRTRLGDEALERLGMPGFDVPYRQRPLVVPVVVRPGLRVWTFDELEVFLSLRYAGNTAAFMQHDYLVVTELGWWWVWVDVREPEPRARWSRETVEDLMGRAV